MIRHDLVCFAAAWMLPSVALAQAAPAVHSLGAVVATSTTTFTMVSQLVSLSDGRVLVSDGARRAVTLLDASLGNARVLLDSAIGKDNTYATGTVGGGAGGGGGGGVSVGRAPGSWPVNFLVRFRGDSSLWFDPVVGAFVVIQPDGTLGRSMAAPVSQPGWRATGVPTSSPSLGLVYRMTMSPVVFGKGGMTIFGVPRPPDAPDTVFKMEDSALVIRMDFTTRATDTLGRVAVGTSSTLKISGNGYSSSGVTSLFPFTDNIVGTSDGSIVIFRTREYRMDWIGPDGAHLPNQKLTYPWRRITDDARQHIVDSVNLGRMHSYDSTMAKRAADSTKTGAAPTRATISVIDGVSTTRQSPIPAPPKPTLAVPDEVPDYYPPVARGTPPLWADAEGNVWIKPVIDSPETGFSIWDVISRTGGVVDRVRVPDPRTIAGFGAGGFVFLVSHDGGVVKLEKVRIR